MRKIADARDARACLKAAKNAGLAPGAWARAHGVDGRSLHAWKVNLTRSSSPIAVGRRRPRLIELVPMSAPRAPTRYVVRIGDAAIEIGDDFADETLARAVRVLRAC